MDTSVLGGDDSSFVSFMLDQEEYTLEFGPDTTIKSIEDAFRFETYTEVEFNNCPEIPVDKLCPLIPLMNSNLKSLIIRNTPWLNDECIEMFTAFCNKLYKIELHGTSLNITRSGIESIARNSGTLLSLSIICTQYNKNTSTDCDMKHTQSDPIINGAHIIQNGINSWNLDSRIFPALINNMTSKLRHFCLSGFPMLTIDGLETFISYFRKTLQSLDFSDLSTMNNDVLKCIGDNCTSLFILKLNRCTQITDEGIWNLFERKSNLEVLELCGCDKLTDQSFQCVSKQSPKLTIIKLDGCSRLTEVSLKLLSKYCRKLSYISMRSTSLRRLPSTLSGLTFLNYFNVSDCKLLSHPEKNFLETGVHNIMEYVKDYNVENRVRVTAMGSLQSGKSSILLSLLSDHNFADGPSFGVPVHVWHPFLESSRFCLVPNESTPDQCHPSLSVELWDCSARRALEGIHSYFLCSQNIYLVCFNVSVHSQVDKVPKYINTIQSRAPGSSIILIASHCDLCSSEKIREATDRVQKKVSEEERNQVQEINEELSFLQDLGLFAMISAKRRRLEWLLEHRPKIHPDVICVSSITGDGVQNLRAVVLNNIMSTMATQVKQDLTSQDELKNLEDVFFEIALLKAKNVLLVTWTNMKNLILQKYEDIKEEELLSLLGQLHDMGGIVLLGDGLIKHLQKAWTCITTANAPNNKPSVINITCESSLLDDDTLICINPPIFANAIAAIHRNETTMQDLVTQLQRDGHVNTLWTGKKPNDWTLRKCFTEITELGIIRESIIPLLVNTVVNLAEEQLLLFIASLKSLNILVEGAANGNYDVELTLPNMKNLNVIKCYYMPLQGCLPIIPQINAWLPKCPPNRIQIGWDYRFVSSVPVNLFLYLISACNVVKKETDTLSYWQSGSYIRNGNIDISVCQWKDKLVLQVLARAVIDDNGGSRQAVNRAWSLLSKYLYTIEMILATFPGLYYEVLALSNSHCKPILEVVDEYEAGEISENDALWDVPLSGCTRNSTHIRSASIPPNYHQWLKGVAAQSRLHISHASDISKELRPVCSILTGAGYDISTDEQGEAGIMEARLIICLLTTSYFEEDRLLSVKNNLSNKKIVLALFEHNVSVENQGYEDILLNKVKVDISGGTGIGASYQPEKGQFQKLVEKCNTAIFGHGSLGEDTRKASVAAHPKILTANGYVFSSSLEKRPLELADIIKKYSEMSAEEELKQVASTAVAAAMATATAEYITKQSNPTMGAKAAAMAAEVADAVAKGDSERASKAVVATAKAVDEVVALTNARQILTKKSNAENESVISTPDKRIKPPTRNRSAMCVVL